MTVRKLVVESAISGLGGVDHLEKDHPVDRDHRIVLGDDLLPRDVDHLLHHVDLAPDAGDKRQHEVDPGLGNAHEAAEMLKRIAIALVDDLDAHHHEQQHQDREYGHEDGYHVSSPNLVFAA